MAPDAELASQCVDIPVWQDSFGADCTLYGTNNWCDADGCLITPTWNHMWFVAYLLVFSLALGGLLSLARGRVAAVQKGLEQALAGPGVLIWPAAFLILLPLLN